MEQEGGHTMCVVVIVSLDWERSIIETKIRKFWINLKYLQME